LSILAAITQEHISLQQQQQQQISVRPNAQESLPGQMGKRKCRNIEEIEAELRAETLELKAQLKKLKNPRQRQRKCRSMEEIEADLRAETLELEAQLKKLKTSRQKHSKSKCRSMEEMGADLRAEVLDIELQPAEAEQQLRQQQIQQHQRQALKQQPPINHLHRTAVGASKTTDASGSHCVKD